jgi:hypothetical protein
MRLSPRKTGGCHPVSGAAVQFRFFIGDTFYFLMRKIWN